MSVSVTLPQLGKNVAGGTVTRWLKQSGDRVEADEPLLEVSTDKVDTEIPSPVSGVVRSILVAEAETVAVGAELAIIDEEGMPSEPMMARGIAPKLLLPWESGQPRAPSRSAQPVLQVNVEEAPGEESPLRYKLEGWASFVIWPLMAACLGFGQLWLFGYLYLGTYIFHFPPLWETALVASVVFIAAVLVARKLARAHLPPGWRASIVMPTLWVGIGITLIGFALWNNNSMPGWWRSVLVLLLPCGLSAAIAVAIQISAADRSFWSWARELASWSALVAVGQSIITFEATKELHPYDLPMYLARFAYPSDLNVAATWFFSFLGLALLVFGVYNIGTALIEIECEVATLPVHERLRDMLDPGRSWQIVEDTLDDLEQGFSDETDVILKLRRLRVEIDNARRSSWIQGIILLILGAAVISPIVAWVFTRLKG